MNRSRNLRSWPHARALVGVGLCACTLALVSGCGAGQITQTATMVPAVPGVNASQNGIALRNGVVQFPTTGNQWAVGSSVPLSLSLVNESPEMNDSLLAISSPLATGVVITSPQATSATPSASQSATRTMRPMATATTSGPTVTPQSTGLPLPLPAAGIISFGNGGRTLQLIGLTQALTAGQSLPVTFTFAHAGTVTVQLPMSAPTAPELRASLTFAPSSPPAA